MSDAFWIILGMMSMWIVGAFTGAIVYRSVIAHDAANSERESK